MAQVLNAGRTCNEYGPARNTAATCIIKMKKKKKVVRIEHPHNSCQKPLINVLFLKQPLIYAPLLLEPIY